jgi:hypothetical protein
LISQSIRQSASWSLVAAAVVAAASVGLVCLLGTLLVYADHHNARRPYTAIIVADTRRLI